MWLSRRGDRSHEGCEHVDDQRDSSEDRDGNVAEKETSQTEDTEEEASLAEDIEEVEDQCAHEPFNFDGINEENDGCDEEADSTDGEEEGAHDPLEFNGIKEEGDSSNEGPDSADELDGVPSWTKLARGSVPQWEWMERWYASQERGFAVL